MAKATRCDNIQINPDGRVFVDYTDGDSPLPNSPSGLQKEFGSFQNFIEWFSEMEESVGVNGRLSFAISPWIKANMASFPNPSAGVLASVKGKKCTMDLDGVSSPITLN